MITTNIPQLIRIKDWFKNIIIFFPLIFTGRVLELESYQNLVVGFITFSFSASFIYILNDIFDSKNDIKHPIKKNRPIASGNFSILNSVYILIFLLILIFILIYLYKIIIYHIVFYLILALLYIIFLKNFPIIEVIILSIFYLIRIDLGSNLINVDSSYLMLFATFSISIYFILLKRIGELNINQSNITRYVLKFYNIIFLKYICILSSIVFIIIICMYIYNTNYILISTLPFILTFLYKYYQNSKNTSIGENPINAIFNDKFLLSNILLTFLIFILILLFYNS
ncbi:MAG: hypothetical protein CBD97_00480 [Pelagibacteraceae bacterium TMED237]|nr:MAG: hypothetical protein CBD97_00480 [Pelagibacteraceae bacterium TMED237]